MVNVTGFMPQVYFGDFVLNPQLPGYMSGSGLW